MTDDLGPASHQNSAGWGVEGYVFAAGEAPYCAWEHDLEARTAELLNGIDVDYFRSVAMMCATAMNGDDLLAASVLLRITYHQAVETLMSLLGATAQAPCAVPAWLASCSTEALKEVVESLCEGRPILTPDGRKGVTFHDLASRFYSDAWPDDDAAISTADSFARFWSRLAREFLDPTNRAEYNALKHGTRVSPGGFTLTVGNEETFGEPAPADAMRTVGGSRFGTTFFVAERVGSTKQNIRTRRTSLNWVPESMVSRVVLISLSIANVVAALRRDLDIGEDSVTLVRPNPLSAFEDAWKPSPGVATFAVDAVVSIDPRDELTRAQLLDILERGVGNT